MKKHKKLSSLERDKIAYWHAIGEGVREIARRLERSPSSICDELKRNKVDGIYHSIYAHKATKARKINSHKQYLLKTRPSLKSYIIEKLELGWSPEQIAGRLEKEIKEGKLSSNEYINHESIYQYIYHEGQKEMRLWEKLPRSHKKRKRWLGRRSWSVKIPHRVSIHKRSEDIDNRTEFGHWEGDTVVGYKHKSGIHTEVERVSRLLSAFLVPRVRAKETYLAQLCVFSNLPKQARKSTTLDNGSEHFLHTRLQTELEMQTYFADPYSSWQRGTNEYTNGLLRRYFPKRTDFRNISQNELNEVVHRLNNIPRKVLRYRTPREVFTDQLSNALKAP